jgi:hypothetical protein
MTNCDVAVDDTSWYPTVSIFGGIGAWAVIMRAFALTTLMLNPAGYLLMKGIAYARHEAFKYVVEHDDSPLEDTWHQNALDWVYPV